MADLEIRFFAPDGTDRNLDEGRILPGVTFEFIENGGMGQASIGVLTRFDAVDYGPSGIQLADVVKIWVGSEAHPRWIGEVTEPDRELSTTEQEYWHCSGQMDRMNSVVLTQQVIVHPGGADLAVFAADILTEYNAILGTSYGSDFVTTNISLSSLSLDNATARRAMDALFDEAQGAVVWGWEVNPSDGLLRMYLRPRQVVIGWQKNVGDGVRLLGERKPLSEVTNCIKPLIGGKAKNPNLLGLIVQDEEGHANSDFEYPVAPDASTGNILLNPSFTDTTLGLITDHWTLTGGATQDGIARRNGGGGGILLPSAGSKVAQARRTPDIAIVPGDTYCFGAWSRNKTGSRRVNGTLIWYDVTNTPVGSPVVAIIQNNTSTWGVYPDNGDGTFGLFTVAPAGATQYSLEFEGDVDLLGFTGGQCIDDVFLYNSSAATQAGWDSLFAGSAAGTVTWNYTADKHLGACCIRVNATTCADSDGDDFSFFPRNGVKAKVDPLQSITTGIWYKSGPTATSTPKMWIRLAPDRSDGSSAAGYSNISSNGTVDFSFTSKINAITFEVASDPSPTLDWTLLSGSITAGSDWAQTEFGVNMREAGDVLFDTGFIRGSAETDFIPGDFFTRTVYATDVCDVGSDAYNSEATYGLRQQPVTIESIRDFGPGAKAALKAWFGKNGVIAPPRRVELDDEPNDFITPATGLQILIAGIEEDLSNQWPTRCVYNWSGKLGISIEPGDPDPTLTKEIIKLGAGSVQVGGGGTSGGGVTYSAVPTPYDITIGGTGADNALDALTNLGLGGGLSFTETTAKLTPGGTNGSKTYVNGIVTAHTPAT